jgi:predicted RNA-binding protein YlxR (DUF448 family)
MLKKKKIPLRMCLGCQEMKPKKELIRVVRTADQGEIKVDLTGKLAGRGAYVCKNAECLEKAYKSKRIERALEHGINSEVYEMLRKEIIPGE